MFRTRRIFQRATTSLLIYALAATLPAGPAHAEINVPAQINDLPLGANIQVVLKTKQKLRGTRGAVSEAGFTLLDSHSAAKQLTFDEVKSVKLTGKSHTTRNVVLVVVLGAVIVATVAFARAAAAFGGG